MSFTKTRAGVCATRPRHPQPDIHATAETLGLDLIGDRFAICPVCGAERSAQLYEGRFKCFHAECLASGTAIDLIALDLDLVEPDGEGRFPKLDTAQMDAVRAVIKDRHIPITTSIPGRPAAATRNPRSRWRKEVVDVWGAAEHAPMPPPTTTFLDMRKLDSEALKDLDLARALPDEADAFPWARAWRKGHLLLLPVYGPTGDLEALRGRWVHLKAPGKKVGKAMPPAWGPGTMSGCVLANPEAINVLRGETTEPITLVVTEGEPDYLTWAIHHPELPVFGVFSGAWTQAIADRIPDGSTVVLRTHHDDAGERYAAKVGASLGARVTLLRSKPTGTPDPKDEPDDNDRHLAGTLPTDPTEDAGPYATPITVVPAFPTLPLQRYKDGSPKGIRTNAELLLREHPAWKNRVWFNAFDIQYYLNDDVLDGVGMLRLAADLGATLGVEFKLQPTQEAVVLVGREDTRHPVADWLDRLTWDGTERLDCLLPTYFGARDRPVVRLMGARWMMGAANRGLRTGAKMDYTLVLVGAQEVKKSTSVRALAVRPTWFHDTSVQVGTKDGLLALQGCWLMELAELSAVRGVQLEAVKAFLTSQTDRFRPPYGSTMESFLRSTAFIATTNDRQFLTDPTGNRRFWPVEVGTIDITALERDREQLWAEAVHRVAAGERHWPSAAEEGQLDRHRFRFEAEDPWLAPLVDWLDERSEPFTLHEAMVEALDLKERDMLRARNRVGAMLRRLGYELKRKRIDARYARLWWQWGAR